MDKGTKVAFYVGEDHRSVVASAGNLFIHDDALEIVGENPRSIPFSEILSVSSEVINGLGTTMRLHLDFEVFHVMVPRLNIKGKFVIVNMIATRRLIKEIQNRVTNH